MVKVGDVVKENQVLIAGIMKGKYTDPRFMHAIGEVEAKTWVTKSKKMNYKQEEFYYTGNEEKGYKIKFKKNEINFGKRVSKFKLYDTIEQEKKNKIFSNFYFPISIVKVINKEKIKEEKTYTEDELINKAKQELEQEMEREIEVKENICNKKINTYKKENYLEVFVTYELKENIGTNEKIKI